MAGVLAPLFALRSEGDLGIGDIRALRELIDWSAGRGLRLVQLLPINETGNDNSPYNAISSVAIEPTTLETTPEALADLRAKDFKKITAKFEVAELVEESVDYPRVKALKRKLLEAAYASFRDDEARRNTKRARAFRAWCEGEKAWLDGYGLFRALMERNDNSELWDAWPEEHSTVERVEEWTISLPGRERREFEDRRRFFSYAQWLASRQWTDVKAYAESRGVALMGDVPYGVSYYSADVFANRSIFRLQWSGGAPPEPYFKEDEFTQKWGQNWGVPVYDWEVMRETGYRWWKQRVRSVRSAFHLFRIDHVLGFYRIYAFPWRPRENADYLPLTIGEARARTGGELPGFNPRDDESPAHREANRREGEEYLRALLEEVGEFRLIGEDLGTVPPYVRPSLTSLGIAGFKIPIWEKKEDGWLIEPWNYERLSIATYATHDHEPLRAYWETRAEAIADGGADAEVAADELKKLGGFASLPKGDDLSWNDEVHGALLEALCRSNSWIVVFMITDLLGSKKRFNVPGTSADSNWSARLSRRCEEWNGEPAYAPILGRLAAVLRDSGRAGAEASSAEIGHRRGKVPMIG